MTKVSIEKPSDEIIKKANLEIPIVLEDGRTITLKKPKVLAEYKLIKALGKDAENKVYVSMCLPLIYIAAIDNVPIPPINSQPEIDALIQRLDDEGISALSKGVLEHFVATENGEDEKEAIKK